MRSLSCQSQTRLGATKSVTAERDDLIRYRIPLPLLATGSATAAPKPDIVLVHGAWEEAWQAVTPLLEQDGYRVS